MLVRDGMSTPAITVEADESVKEGLRLLDRHRITSLPVTGPGGRLVGIVSEADLLRDTVRADDRVHMTPSEQLSNPPTQIADVMSTLCMTVTADTDLHEAVELMTSTAVKSLPVVEEGQVVGVLSRSDVVHLLARDDERISGEVDELLRSAGLECEVSVRDGIVTLAGTTDPSERRIARVVAGNVAGVIAVQVK